MKEKKMTEPRDFDSIVNDWINIEVGSDPLIKKWKESINQKILNMRDLNCD